ncbi:MAG: hypothetical protein IJR68_02405 [Fretibacterium sp.]|nr:hypothetical protein [Fretibacterium sp.]
MSSFLKNNAPARGYILAYYPDTLVFEPYILQGDCPVFEGWEALRGAKPRECHLFDDSREVRIINRESAKDRLEIVLTREEERGMDPDLIFVEDVLVKPQYAGGGGRPKTLKIINRYRYSAFDTLTLDNYRISCEAAQLKRRELL